MLWWLPALSTLSKKLLSLAFEHHFRDPVCLQLCVCFKKSAGLIPQGEAGAGAVCVEADRPLDSRARNLFTYYFVNRNKTVGDIFLLLSNGLLRMYLSISFGLNCTPDHCWILLSIFPHSVFLISTSTSLFCSLLQQHCTLQYFSFWNYIAFWISLISLFSPFCLPPFHSSSPIVQYGMRHLPFTLHHSLHTTSGAYSQSLCHMLYTTTIFISDFEEEAAVSSGSPYTKVKLSFLPSPITHSHPY